MPDGPASETSVATLSEPTGQQVIPSLTCPSIYPPSADAPHDGPGWAGPVRCVLGPDHQGDRHWNSGINWTEKTHG